MAANAGLPAALLLALIGLTGRSEGKTGQFPACLNILEYDILTWYYLTEYPYGKHISYQ